MFILGGRQLVSIMQGKYTISLINYSTCHTGLIQSLQFLAYLISVINFANMLKNLVMRQKAIARFFYLRDPGSKVVFVRKNLDEIFYPKPNSLWANNQ